MTRPVKDKRQRTQFPADELLQQLIQRGAAALVAAALEAELQDFLQQHAHLRTISGAKAIVRNGYLPKRTLFTTLGDIEVQVPRVRDRGHTGVYFTSTLVPPYLKRAQNYDEQLPRLYLQGLARGNFEEALLHLLGQPSRELSQRTASYLHQQWLEEHSAWRQQSMERKRYLYWHADHLKGSAETDQSGLLLLAGITEDGYRELIAISEDAPDTHTKWLQLLEDLLARGLKTAPKFVDSEHAAGFAEVFTATFQQPAEAAAFAFEKADQRGNSQPANTARLLN